MYPVIRFYYYWGRAHRRKWYRHTHRSLGWKQETPSRSASARWGRRLTSLPRGGRGACRGFAENPRATVWTNVDLWIRLLQVYSRIQNYLCGNTIHFKIQAQSSLWAASFEAHEALRNARSGSDYPSIWFCSLWSFRWARCLRGRWWCHKSSSSGPPGSLKLRSSQPPWWESSIISR